MFELNKYMKVISVDTIFKYKIKYLEDINKNNFIEVSLLGEEHYVTDFLYYNNSYEDVKELQGILEDVLNDELFEEIISTNILCSYIEKDYTYFFEDDDITLGKNKAIKHKLMFIETSIFREVVFKWAIFLESKLRSLP